MIVLSKIQGNTGDITKEGVPINNFIGCNTTPDGVTWVRYWDGAEIRKMVVQESLEEIAAMMNYARNGTMPHGKG
jgi:hypothetical protein